MLEALDDIVEEERYAFLDDDDDTSNDGDTRPLLIDSEEFLDKQDKTEKVKNG